MGIRSTCAASGGTTGIADEDCGSADVIILQSVRSGAAGCGVDAACVKTCGAIAIRNFGCAGAHASAGVNRAHGALWARGAMVIDSTGGFLWRVDKGAFVYDGPAPLTV